MCYWLSCSHWLVSLLPLDNWGCQFEKFKRGSTQNRKRLETADFISYCKFVLVIVTALVAGNYINYMTNMQSIELLRQSVRKAVVQCYAIEGAYPPDIDYLEKEYSLEYNHDKYYIDYEVFASNVMPNVEVYERE